MIFDMNYACGLQSTLKFASAFTQEKIACALHDCSRITRYPRCRTHALITITIIMYMNYHGQKLRAERERCGRAVAKRRLARQQWFTKKLITRLI